MINLYTIGFTNKSAQQFFQLLETNHIEKIVDTRISNTSQLSGFAKGKDLAFFAKKISSINYEYQLEFAPTKELLVRYKTKKLSWKEYEVEYLNLLDIRGIKRKVKIQDLDRACLLCSEHLPDKCHRRLLAEYLSSLDNTINIIHLK